MPFQKKVNIVNLSRTSSASTASNTSSHSSSNYFFPNNSKLRCPNCRLKFMSAEMVNVHMANCQAKATKENADENGQKENRKKEEEDGDEENEENEADDAFPNDGQCKICDRHFSPRGLKIHNTRMHRRQRKGKVATPPVKEAGNPPPVFKCDKCLYQTRYKNNLKLHEETHQGQQGKIQIECKFCGESFGTHFAKKQHEKTHEIGGNMNLGEQPATRRIQVARRTPISATSSVKKDFATSKSTTPTAVRSKFLGQSNSGSAQILRSPNAGTKRTHGQAFEDGAEEGDEEDDEEMSQPAEKKLAGRPRELVARNNVAQAELAAVGTPSISNYAGMVVNACAQSNLVTFHDVDTLRGTIGKITFQFQCNKCRGQLGVARCYRGRAYCVICCGHPDCD